MPGMIGFSDRVMAPSDLLIRNLGGESVLLNLQTEIYFGFDTTSTRMWELVTSEPNIEAVGGKLAAEFEVDGELLRHNLMELLSRLVEQGLIRVVPTNVASLPEI